VLCTFAQKVINGIRPTLAVNLKRGPVRTTNAVRLTNEKCATKGNSRGLSFSKLAVRLDFLNRAFYEQFCALTPAQAHDRPSLPLMPRSGFVNEATGRSASRGREHDVIIALNLSDIPLCQNSQPSPA
jgi:hypothetical protein